jgi:hypothetical protein
MAAFAHRPGGIQLRIRGFPELTPKDAPRVEIFKWLAVWAFGFGLAMLVFG